MVVVWVLMVAFFTGLAGGVLGWLAERCRGWRTRAAIALFPCVVVWLLLWSGDPNDPQAGLVLLFVLPMAAWNVVTFIGAYALSWYARQVDVE
jgi:hypothetical protein